MIITIGSSIRIPCATNIVIDVRIFIRIIVGKQMDLKIIIANSINISIRSKYTTTKFNKVRLK